MTIPGHTPDGGHRRERGAISQSFFRKTRNLGFGLMLHRATAAADPLRRGIAGALSKRLARMPTESSMRRPSHRHHQANATAPARKSCLCRGADSYGSQGIRAPSGERADV